MGDCYIIGAGDFFPEGLCPRKGDLVIAADGGFAHLQALGLPADLVVGDFDSSHCPAHPHVIRHDPVKDDTDLLLAVRLGLERGYARFFLYGGTGGARPEHSIANLQVLGFLQEHDAVGYLMGERHVFTWLREERLHFPAGYRGFFSLFSMSARLGSVTLRGLKYPLEDRALTNTLPLGVSNEFLGVPALVEVHDGDGLAVWERQPLPLPEREALPKEVQA